MAEAVMLTIGSSLASGLLKALLQKSVNALSEASFTRSQNLESQLGDFNRELAKLDALLCSAPVHHNRNALLLDWLKRVNDAANFADNLLDDISYERIRLQAESNAVSNLLLPRPIGSLGFLIKIGRKLSKFMSMIDQIYNEGLKIGLKPVELVASPSSYESPAAMSPDLREIRENVDTSVVVGREADEELIVSELCRPSNEQVLGVIAIVGMSGVGKTTLARKIYDNQIVTEQYKKKIWIFVSDHFNLRRFLAEMFQSLTTGVNTDASVSGVLNIDAMEQKLKSCLEKDRYLLVLDDVWNMNQHVWDSIRTSLVRVAKGCTGSSMVLVTTQLEEVASIMGASMSYGVKILSEHDSQELFEGKAFANKSPKQVSYLRDIGQRILSKCEGLPLAINTLASLLATMNERSQWESVERSQLWNLPTTSIMPWLLLCFNNLPSAAIKRCFAHCSILIPKGEGVLKGTLITSWFAQGFIQLPETSDQDMMAIGQPYIKSMCDHGLLQLYSDDGYCQRFTMHNLMHDLAVYVSGDKYLTIREHDDLHKASSGVEHVLIHGGNAFNSQLNFPKGNAHRTLRALIWRHTTVSIDLVVQARFLRQLMLVDCGLKEIPRSIGRLKHLKRLCIRDNPIKDLPDSIGSLYNLQVLLLYNCHMLFKLPQQVTKLLNLRWLGTMEDVHMPKGLGQLTRLERVPPFKLKAGNGCRIKELGSLKNLVDTLKIKQLENIRGKEEAMEAYLKRKAGIQYLTLEWSSEGNEGDIIYTNDEEVMEGLQPHSNLKRLWVENFRGKRFSLWLSSGHCNNLTALTLLNCKRCEKLPTLGCLPSLKFLVIDGMESVEVIGSDFFACSSTGSQSNLFPCLEDFYLRNMPKLNEWFDPSGSYASTFQCLQRLDIKGVNSGEPLLMILRNSNKLTSLTVENIQKLTCLSEPLLKCTSLQLLKIKGCKELVELAPTLQSLACLKTLSIEYCDSLTSLPDIKGLLSLKGLKIDSCKQIIDTPCGLESCVSIERLEVRDCSEFIFNDDLVISSSLRSLFFYYLSKQTSVPRWLNHLSNLTLLGIGGFNNDLNSFCGIEHLPKSLKSLGLGGWLKLKSLPDELQSFTQLETLTIWEFNGVKTLPEWLGNLSSLQTLKIWNCENMKHLPSLDAMRRLTRLGELEIKGCPWLEERCRKEGGEEWLKISHISHIHITAAPAT